MQIRRGLSLFPLGEAGSKPQSLREKTLDQSVCFLYVPHAQMTNTPPSTGPADRCVLVFEELCARLEAEHGRLAAPLVVALRSLARAIARLFTELALLREQGKMPRPASA